MSEKPTIILVDIEEVRGGWHVATSKELSNFLMCLPNLSDLIKDIPNVIKALYRAQHGIEVDVKEGAAGDNRSTWPLRYIAERKAA